MGCACRADLPPRAERPERLVVPHPTTDLHIGIPGVGEEDLQLFYTTYNWPNNVKTYMTRSQEIQQARKRHLEMVVEGQQEQLSREMVNLEKKVEKIAEHGSLAPPEVQQIYRRILNVKDSLDAAQLEVDNIAQQEELLQMPLTDNESKLTEITQALKPLEELWRIAKTWVEQIHMWQESPLSDVDAEDAERKCIELGTARAVPDNRPAKCSSQVADAFLSAFALPSSCSSIPCHLLCAK